jgi:hypothetical protein
MNIADDDFKGLSDIGDEFRFGDLAPGLSQFRDSDDLTEAETEKDSEAQTHLSALDWQRQQCDHEISSPNLKLSQLEADRATEGTLI